MRIIGIVIGLFFSAYQFIQAQSIQEILNNHILLSVTEKSRQEFLNSIDGINFRYPLLDEINLRTETDRNNWSRQEYVMRVMFNNFGLSKTFRRESQLLKEKIALRSKKIEQNLIYDLYKDIVTVFFNNQKDSIYTSQIANDEDQIQYLISLVKSGTLVNAKDILRLESNIYENQNNKELLRKNNRELLLKWNITKPPTPLLINDSTLYSTIHKLNFTNIQTSKNLEENIDQEIDDIDYQIDRKDDRRVLDYLQLRYSKRDNLLFRDEFSIGMGIRIPYRGRHDYTSTKHKVKRLESIYKLDIEKATFEFEIFNEIKDFDKIFDNLIHIKKQQIERTTLLNINHLENINTLEIFKKDITLAYAEKTLELRQKLWEKYLEILHKGELLDTLSITN